MRAVESGTGPMSVRLSVRVGRQAHPTVRAMLSALDEDLSMLYPGSGLTFAERRPQGSETKGGSTDTEFVMVVSLTGILAAVHVMEWSIENFPAMHSQLKREICL